MFLKSVNTFLRAVEVLGALGVSGVLNISIFTFFRKKSKHHICNLLVNNLQFPPEMLLLCIYNMGICKNKYHLYLLV